MVRGEPKAIHAVVCFGKESGGIAIPSDVICVIHAYEGPVGSKRFLIFEIFIERRSNSVAHVVAVLIASPVESGRIGGDVGGVQIDRRPAVDTCKTKVDLVLHIHDGSTVARGSKRVVVSAITVNAYGLVETGSINPASHVGRTRIITRVVIHDENEVGSTVVNKRFVKGNEGPFVGSHGDAATEHLVVCRYINPIGIAEKIEFIGRLQIDVVCTGLRVVLSLVIEGDAGDVACRTNLVSGVDLL